MKFEIIVVIILMLICCLVQIAYVFLEKDFDNLLLCKKMKLGKIYYLNLECISNHIVLMLNNQNTTDRFEIKRVYEKGMKLYLISDTTIFIFNDITKKMKIDKIKVPSN